MTVLRPHRRPLLLAVCAVATLAFTAASVAALGGGLGTVRAASKVKVKCPKDPAKGKTVKCKLKGKLPEGPEGPEGPQGPAGDPGLSGYEIVNQTFTNVFALNSGGQRGLSEVKTVSCPAGKRAIGGGVDLGTNPTENGDQRQMVLSASFPNSAGDGWSVQLFNNSTSLDNALDVKAYAVCANVS